MASFPRYLSQSQRQGVSVQLACFPTRVSDEYALPLRPKQEENTSGTEIKIPLFFTAVDKKTDRATATASHVLALGDIIIYNNIREKYCSSSK